MRNVENRNVEKLQIFFQELSIKFPKFTKIYCRSGDKFECLVMYDTF